MAALEMQICLVRRLSPFRDHEDIVTDINAAVFFIFRSFFGPRKEKVHALSVPSKHSTIFMNGTVQTKEKRTRPKRRRSEEPYLRSMQISIPLVDAFSLPRERSTIFASGMIFPKKKQKTASDQRES